MFHFEEGSELGVFSNFLMTNSFFLIAIHFEGGTH